MLGNKNHLLEIAILLIASVGLYYGTRTEEDKLASAMESAVEDHEREEALIYASKLLELQPGHPQAKRVIAQSVAIFTQLQAAREGLSEFWNRSDATTATPGSHVFFPGNRGSCGFIVFIILRTLSST